MLSGIVEQDCDILESALSVEKVVEYYRDKIPVKEVIKEVVKEVEKEVPLSTPQHSQFQPSSFAESGIATELFKSMLKQNREETDYRLEIKDLENKLESNHAERDRLAGLVSKLGSEKFMFHSYNVEYRNQLRTMQVRERAITATAAAAAAHQTKRKTPRN